MVTARLVQSLRMTLPTGCRRIAASSSSSTAKRSAALAHRTLQSKSSAELNSLYGFPNPHTRACKAFSKRGNPYMGSERRLSPRFPFIAAGGNLFRANAKIVYAVEHMGAGVSFEEIDAASAPVLDRWLAEAENNQKAR